MESFASKVKSELRENVRMAPHCRQAQKHARKIFSNPAAYELFEPKKDCCVRAYLRGAFLEAGSLSDPKKGYHFDITCPNEAEALHLITMLEGFSIDAKMTERKGRPLIYIKEGGQIRDLLTMMGAPVSMMNFENARILKEVRGDVNRRVNCETGNINKAVTAGLKQVRAIRALEEAGELARLSDALYDMAQLRLANPDATLEELGAMASPPVSKSGVNHRLRKICEKAEQL